MEWIQGEGGIVPLTHELRAGRANWPTGITRCWSSTKSSAAWAGRAPTSRYQLASQPIMPDVMVAAKPLACGLPLGVIVANEKAAAAIGPGMHGSTFGGSALACRVALEFFDILEELLPPIHRVGGYFRLLLERAGAEAFVHQGSARASA